MTSAKAWGIDARLLTPAEVKELVPFINEEIILGGFYTPSVSVVDSLQTGTLMREEAVAAGASGVRQHRGPRPRGRSTARSPRWSPPRAGSRRSTSSSPAACGARGSRRWPARRSRSPRRSIRWPMSARSTSSRRRARRSPTRSCATWTRSVTSASRRARWRSAPTLTARSSCTPTTSRRTRSRRCPPPSCRSRPTTSIRSSSRRIELMGEILDDRRDPLRDQRSAVAHPRRDAGARRDGRGPEPVVRRRGVDQGRPGHRPARRRVDDLRLSPAVRPAPSDISRFYAA